MWGERESLIAMEKTSRFARNDNERELPVTSHPSLVPRSGQAHKRPVGHFHFWEDALMGLSWRIASGYQKAGTRPSLKLSLMYFLTSSDWKILTNFW